jgi:ABC-2 type transport system permease protein
MPATMVTETRDSAGAPDHAVARAGDLLAGEWTKLRSARPTQVALLGTAAIMIVVGAWYCYHLSGQWAQTDRDPVRAPFVLSLLFAQLGAGVLGVLAITSEFASGMIRTTFTAVPQRGAALAAKATAVGLLVLTAGEVLSLITFFVGEAFLGRHGVTLAYPGALRAVVGSGCYLAAVALLGVGLGAIFRSTAGSIVAMFVLTFLATSVFGPVPQPPWSYRIYRYLLPANADRLISGHAHNGQVPSVLVAMLICAAYPAITLAAGTFLIRRRDA